MNLPKTLADLRLERDLIDRAIAYLERLLAASSKPRRGRPPVWLQAHKGRERKPAESRQPPRVMTAGACQE
jgi:hypothetical protein